MQQGAGPALIQALLKFKTELLDDPRRSILGAAQEAWFAQELGRAKARGARWQIVPQQIVMGQQAAPPEAVRFLAADAPEFVRQRLTAAAMLGQAGLGWNLDSWGGYPKARERFLAACAQKGTNVVVLSGEQSRHGGQSSKCRTRRPRSGYARCK
jgi:alkaline phosphatase D